MFLKRSTSGGIKYALISHSIGGFQLPNSVAQDNILGDSHKLSVEYMLSYRRGHFKLGRR